MNIKEKIIVIIVIIFLTSLIALSMITPFQEAKVYNKIHGTDFTGWDFIWAGNQINTQTQTINLHQ